MTYSKTLLLFLLLLGLSTTQKDPRTEFFPKLEEKPEAIPAKENLWVFILAGQSNMAGRGKIEPMDTIPDPRILTINKTGEVILAKEPLHFYEPTLTGLDCGLSFGKELLKYIPDSVSILLIPTAVGGSAIQQWISDLSSAALSHVPHMGKKRLQKLDYYLSPAALVHILERHYHKIPRHPLTSVVYGVVINGIG